MRCNLVLRWCFVGLVCCCCFAAVIAVASTTPVRVEFISTYRQGFYSLGVAPAGKGGTWYYGKSGAVSLGWNPTIYTVNAPVLLFWSYDTLGGTWSFEATDAGGPRSMANTSYDSGNYWYIGQYKLNNQSPLDSSARLIYQVDVYKWSDQSVWGDQKAIVIPSGSLAGEWTVSGDVVKGNNLDSSASAVLSTGLYNAQTGRYLVYDDQLGRWYLAASNSCWTVDRGWVFDGTAGYGVGGTPAQPSGVTWNYITSNFVGETWVMITNSSSLTGAYDIPQAGLNMGNASSVLSNSTPSISVSSTNYVYNNNTNYNYNSVSNYNYNSVSNFNYNYVTNVNNNYISNSVSVNLTNVMDVASFSNSMMRASLAGASFVSNSMASIFGAMSNQYADVSWTSQVPGWVDTASGSTNFENMVYGSYSSRVADVYFAASNQFDQTRSFLTGLWHPLSLLSDERLTSIVIPCRFAGRDAPMTFSLTGYMDSINGFRDILTWFVWTMCGIIMIRIYSGE